MKAVIGRELGAPEGYELTEMPVPSPKNGEVRIRVEAAGLGYVDALLTRGDYQVRPPTPYIPATEFAGTYASGEDHGSGGFGAERRLPVPGSSSSMRRMG